MIEPRKGKPSWADNLRVLEGNMETRETRLAWHHHSGVVEPGMMYNVCVATRETHESFKLDHALLSISTADITTNLRVRSRVR